MPEPVRWDVRRFPPLASTNATARELAAEGAPEGAVVVADEQSAGRGRHGRSWRSPAGAGLYATLLLRPTTLPARAAPALTFAAAVSVAEALASLGVAGVSLKWPNDVLVNGRKVCGVLTEASFAESRVEWAVVGIGVNLTDDAVPEAPVVAATSLEASGVRASRDEALAALLERFGVWYATLLAGGSREVLARWSALAPMARGSEVTVDDGRETYAATTDGLAEAGLLRVRRADGRVAELSAADVTLGRR